MAKQVSCPECEATVNVKMPVLYIVGGVLLFPLGLLLLLLPRSCHCDKCGNKFLGGAIESGLPKSWDPYLLAVPSILLGLWGAWKILDFHNWYNELVGWIIMFGGFTPLFLGVFNIRAHNKGRNIARIGVAASTVTILACFYFMFTGGKSVSNTPEALAYGIVTSVEDEFLRNYNGYVEDNQKLTEILSNWAEKYDASDQVDQKIEATALSRKQLENLAVDFDVKYPDACSESIKLLTRMESALKTGSESEVNKCIEEYQSDSWSDKFYENIARILPKKLEEAAVRLSDENVHADKIDSELANRIRDYKSYLYKVADAIRNQDYQKMNTLIERNIEFVNKINEAMRSAGYPIQ